MIKFAILKEKELGVYIFQSKKYTFLIKIIFSRFFNLQFVLFFGIVGI